MAVATVNARAAVKGGGALERVRVRALASSGAGVADLANGRVAFVPRTAPGDVADVRVGRVRKRWAEATLVRLVEPAPERVEAPCPLFDRCGGCALQHLDYATQLAWKGSFVADAMLRIGGIDIEAPAVAPSPRRTAYRNRLTFTVRRLRTGRVVAGFHALGDPDRIVDVRGECLLPEPGILEAWTALRATWRRDSPWLLPGARELRLTLRAVDEGVLLLVRGGREGWNAGDVIERVAAIRAVWHQPEGHADARLVAGAHLHESRGEERIPVGGHAFLQVNRDAVSSLVAHVLERAGAGSRAVDAYAGVGVYGRALAGAGWRVTGIERDREACAAARHDAPTGFEVVEGAVEACLEESLPADLVILNPPRTGVAEEVPEILLRHRPARVIYVSCDPATLARDAKRMVPRYAPVSVRSWDLFPQTVHVETVAVFEAEA
jgi:23S rRNA (uracil1939-C5)-methyltransferase